MKEELRMLLDLGLSALLGFLIGFERKLRSKEAGIRTHTILSVGACLMMLISLYGFGKADADASRVAAQIVSGISFLGAGIIVYRKHEVKGLTTAAGVWATAAIGMACGARLYVLACAGCVLLIALQLLFHTPLKIFSPKRFYIVKITFIEKTNERHKVKELFKVTHYNHLVVERVDDKLLFKATIFTDKEFDSVTIDNIMKTNEYIISIERGDED
jgi:putative Mg2+ transporter-C (MgtC) family protein